MDPLFWVAAPVSRVGQPVIKLIPSIYLYLLRAREAIPLGVMATAAAPAAVVAEDREQQQKKTLSAGSWLWTKQEPAPKEMGWWRRLARHSLALVGS